MTVRVWFLSNDMGMSAALFEQNLWLRCRRHQLGLPSFSYGAPLIDDHCTEWTVLDTIARMKGLD